MNTDLGFVGVKRRDAGSEGANRTRSNIPVRVQAMKQRPGGPYPTNPSEVPPIRSPAIFVPPQPRIPHGLGTLQDLTKVEARANMARLNPPVPPPKLEETPSPSSEDIYYVHAGSGDDFEYPEDTDEAEAPVVVTALENRKPGIGPSDPKNKLKHAHDICRFPVKELRQRPRHPDESGFTDQFLAQAGHPIEPQQGEFLAEAGHPISHMGGQKPNHPVPEKDREPVIFVPAPAPPVTTNPPPSLSFTEFMNMYQLYKEFTRSGTI